MKSQPGKVNPFVLIFIVIVAFGGFVATDYVQVRQEFAAVDAKLNEMEGKMKVNVETLRGQIENRYITLLKMSEDLSSYKTVMESIQRTIQSEREALRALQENFRAELAQARQLGGDANRMVTELEEKLKQDMKVREVRMARLHDDYASLKNQLEDHNALLVMMREQALLNQATRPSTEPKQPADSSSTPSSPSEMLSPQPGSSTTITPQNNRVVTDLPTSN